MSDAKAQKLTYDVNNTPYSFLFDETTDSHVKKTVRRVLVILVKSPPKSSQLICWRFVKGHCKVDDLVEHYNEFAKIMQLDYSYFFTSKWMDRV